MARIPLDTERRSPLTRLAAWYSRREIGKVAEPIAAWSHHPGVLWVTTRMEMGVQRRWRRLDATLQALAVMVTTVRIGCPWCVDFAYWEFHHKGVDHRKLEDVPNWRSSDVYTELERLVLEYAEAMTETPPAVGDELVASLRMRLDDARLVELTSLVALENMRSRTNAALGLQSQGFKATCEPRRA